MDVSYEAIRTWVHKFGLQIARNLKRLRPAPSPRWHLDEMVSRIGGRHRHLWRAVDDEGEVLGTTVAKRHHASTAVSFIEKLLREQPVSPTAIVTDGLKSYVSAVDALGPIELHRPGRLRENNRVENSHLPIRQRERRMQGFKSQISAQRFLPTHTAVYNTFNMQRHLASRPAMKLFRAAAHHAWRPGMSGEGLLLKYPPELS